MTKLELLEMIQNGENSYVEFKLDSVSSDELAREVVAFANADGGSILLGIADSGEVEGVSRADLEEWAMNLCRNNCVPAILPFFEKVVNVVEGKDVAVLRIPRGLAAVYKTNRGRWMIRVGSTSRDATTEEVARVFQQRGLVHFDIAPVPGMSQDELDRIRWNHYLEKILKLEASKIGPRMEQVMLNTKVMVRTEQGAFLSIAGALVFGREPERFLPQAGITAVRFRGTRMDYEVIDRKDITGPLINKVGAGEQIEEDGAIDKAVKFVQQNTKTSSKMEGIIRKDIPQYVEDAVREAVVNAVAHRHYSITGSRIRLFIFDDRIEIRSPGKIPNTVSIEEMKQSCHYARNPEIVKFLHQHGYGEDIGLGIPEKILRLSREHSGREPKIEEIGHELVVTLYPYVPDTSEDTG